jgi:hypothetical protein
MCTRTPGLPVGIAIVAEETVTPDGAAMSDETMDAIERFVPERSGVNYRAHVTTKSVPAAEAKQLESQPFQAFTFNPSALRSINSAGSELRSGSCGRGPESPTRGARKPPHQRYFTPITAEFDVYGR